MKLFFCLLALLAMAALAPKAALAEVCGYTVQPVDGNDLRTLELDVDIACDLPAQPDDFSFGYGGGRFAEWRDDRLGYRIRLGELSGARSPRSFGMGWVRAQAGPDLADCVGAGLLSSGVKP